MLPSRVIKLEQHRTRHQESPTPYLLESPLLPALPSARQFAKLNRQVSEYSRALSASLRKLKTAFLPGSARNTKSDVTHSKQSPIKFLTGARTASQTFSLPTHFRFAAILIAYALLATSAWSQSPTAAPLDSQDVGTFLDKYFAEHMEKFHDPGAVVAIVKDGEVLAIKGYGYQNVEQKITVDPDRTVFRLASVSKPFTAVAVLQLVEQGKLRLDENVNHYLHLFQLEENYPQPVTLANLLTHSGGLDDRGIGLSSLTPAGQIPLGPYLARRWGARVMPPGDQYSYSNSGFSLAGYIVETTSGVPFAQYIDDHIFKPLDMRQSGFVITPELYKNLAVGYDYLHGHFVPVPLDYPNVAPAAAMVSTAPDMARFMIAELQLGRYGTQRILSEDSAQRMFQRQFANDPRLPATAFAYWEDFPNGVRVVRQDGDWMGAVSTIYLLPAEKVGIFIACNVGDQSLIDDLLHQFMDRYFPAKPEISKPPVAFESPDPPSRFAGSYRLNRYAHQTFEKTGTLFHQWEVLPGEKGGIMLMNPNLGPQNYVPVSPLLFRHEGTQEEIAFRQDEDGRITRVALGRYVLEKLPWYESAIVQKTLFAFFGGVFGLSVLIALLVWIKKKRSPSASPDAKNLASLRYWTAGVAAANLLFLGGMFLSFLNKGALAYGLPFYVALLLCIPLLTTAAAPVILWYAFRAWQTRSGSPLPRAFHSLVALAALCFIPFLIYWNLLGFHY